MKKFLKLALIASLALTAAAFSACDDKNGGNGDPKNDIIYDLSETAPDYVNVATTTPDETFRTFQMSYKQIVDKLNEGLIEEFPEEYDYLSLVLKDNGRFVFMGLESDEKTPEQFPAKGSEGIARYSKAGGKLTLMVDKKFVISALEEEMDVKPGTIKPEMLSMLNKGLVTTSGSDILLNLDYKENGNKISIYAEKNAANQTIECLEAIMTLVAKNLDPTNPEHKEMLESIEMAEAMAKDAKAFLASCSKFELGVNMVMRPTYDDSDKKEE